MVPLMADIRDGFKDIFLAGVGALAYGGERANELVNNLIEKGELTVEQGKEHNTELKHKANDAFGPMMPLQQQLRTPPNSTLSSVRVSVGAGARRAFESAAHAKTST